VSGLRAGVVVTGTEVLTGIIGDKNGPWLSERLREVGIDHAFTTVVGDRPSDVRAALDFMAAAGVDLIITSGGLGPTADDLTAEVVGEFLGRPMELDEGLEARIATILARLTRRWPNVDQEAIRAGNRKQAIIPAGATVLEPVGTAPGLVVPPAAAGSGLPLVMVLPGPPRELQPMWGAALETELMRALLEGQEAYETRIVRMMGIPESDLASTLRAIEEEDGLSLSGLEITTCLRRGEIEIATTFVPSVAESLYVDFEAALDRRYGEVIFARRGETIDEIVAGLLRDGGLTIATGESCTGGLLAARLTELPGSSSYALGGVVAYSNEAKSALLEVDPGFFPSVGAVSEEVARALAEGARSRFGASVGVGITGIAGPDGGTPDKPVGTVCIAVAGPSDARLERRLQIPGDRASVRERSATIALHLVRRLLLGPPVA
jgi:nicotinamide-nucleotide amidase